MQVSDEIYPYYIMALWPIILNNLGSYIHIGKGIVLVLIHSAIENADTSTVPVPVTYLQAIPRISNWEAWLRQTDQPQSKKRAFVGFSFKLVCLNLLDCYINIC